ncbi:MAG: hypothetical protein RJQ09_05520 [Cyclobacteriaceae bacterium]
MAITIKSIPVLRGNEATAFVNKAEQTYSQEKGAIDFSKEVKIASKILSKAAKR